MDNYSGNYSDKIDAVNGAAEREAAAMVKMKDYSLARPAGRFMVNNPQNNASYYAKPSIEEMQESLSKCLDSFDRMIKAERNRLK